MRLPGYSFILLSVIFCRMRKQEKVHRKRLRNICHLEGITTRAEIVSELVRRVAECDELDEHTRLIVIRLLSQE